MLTEGVPVMCDCLNGAFICEVCGVLVSVWDTPLGPALFHLVEHGPQPDGVDRALWERHTLDVCLQARKLHWMNMLRGGLAAAIAVYDG